jgi:hypothetical protein
MQYYVVTEGRANVLDRLRLRDRSTYGLDWMVFDAGSAGEGIRQWNLYKAGTHPQQAELEAEGAQYRAATSGYAPAWKAEREAIAVEAAGRLRAVEAEQRLLREKQADLDVVRRSLRRVAAAAPTPTRTRRRAVASSSKEAPRRPKRAKIAKRSATKARVRARPRRRRR